MWVKKFKARTIAEAMAQVKAELGSEAVILNTAQIKVGGFFGLFGTRMVEVTAAADRTNAPAAVPPSVVNGAHHAAAGSQDRIAVSMPAAATAPPGISAGPTGALAGRTKTADPIRMAEPDNLAAMRAELSNMKQMMGLVLDQIQEPQGSVPARPEGALPELQAMLTDAGIEPDLAAELVGRVRAVAGRRRLTLLEARNLVRDELLVGLNSVSTIAVETGSRQVIALVGPTGVGKTTTLAKLAAHYVLGRRLKVALVTSDTYRVAAVEQLRTYADILGVPLEVAYDSRELAAAISRHENRDLILVDTAGRSPRSEEHMRELVADLEALQADEIYLVLSMTSSMRDADRIVESYKPAGCNRIIFTKWDETDSPGLVYNVVSRHGLPLSYLTYGQNVPDDIEVADPEKITRSIIGE